MSPGRRAFAYWREPLCLGAAALYAVNRWLVPAALQAAWWRGHFADLLLVPVGLPIWLGLERALGWRTHDGAPRWGEIAFVAVTWAIAAEAIAPRLFAGPTADAWDVVAYAVGAVAVGLRWQWPAA
ncbi:MAG: hypothetical protein R2708_01725 [Vicinamibacterales bacterium]